MEGAQPNCVQVHIGGEGITFHVYILTYTISSHVFVLKCLVLFVEI